MKRYEWNAIKAAFSKLNNKVGTLQTQVDSLGKIVQTKEGDGTAYNPYKTWKSGTSVKAGDWWQTDDGYLWEAIKDGVPASSTDREYWDVIE